MNSHSIVAVFEERKNMEEMEDRDEAERGNEHKDRDSFRILTASHEMTQCVPKVWSSFVVV